MKRYSDKDIELAVEQSISVAQVLRKLNLRPTGGNYKSMRSHFKRLNLDTSHFKGKGYLKGQSHNWNPTIPLNQILVENSSYTNTWRLKKRLLDKNLLTNECCLCGQPPIWKGEPLVLVLDHKNGINNDHRLRNLRLVCPNCNSQLPTHAGKNKGKYK